MEQGHHLKRISLGDRHSCPVAQNRAKVRAPCWSAVQKRLDIMTRSPPMRGRGSKHGGATVAHRGIASPPMRGRGSKHENRAHAEKNRRRPSCEGVDRNPLAALLRELVRVAPHAGRGSKHGPDEHRLANRGRPSCGGVDRNLKIEARMPLNAGRPSCGGVDRNIASGGIPASSASSPLMRGRGSKPGEKAAGCGGPSPLMRGRGSKRDHAALYGRESRRPSCGGVDQNSGRSPERLHRRSPLTRGRGSKRHQLREDARRRGRPSCGGVDRNGAK